MSLRAEIRELRRQLPQRPWLFARLAELLALTGRKAEALRLLEEGLERLGDYPSARQVLGRLLLDEGFREEAEGQLSACADGTVGICAARLDLLAAAGKDPERRRELLEQAYDLDRFSQVRAREMRELGLLDEPEFYQSLEPSAAERDRREIVFAEMIERFGAPRRSAGADDQRAEISADPQRESFADSQPEPQAPEAIETEAEPEEAVEQAHPAPGAETRPDEETPADRRREDRLKREGQRLRKLADLQAPGADGEDPDGEGREAPQQPELPDPAPSHSDLRSVRTRSLAGIYEAQAYYALALEVYEFLQEAEPGNPDLQRRVRKLKARLKRQEAESRAVAKSPSRSGKKKAASRRRGKRKGKDTSNGRKATGSSGT